MISVFLVFSAMQNRKNDCCPLKPVADSNRFNKGLKVFKRYVAWKEPDCPQKSKVLYDGRYNVSLYCL